MKRVDHSHLLVAAQTHPGMTGKNNEDRYAVSAYQLAKGGRFPVLFAILADGVGGHRAGEVAAEMTVEHISRQVAESSGKKPLDTLKTAIMETSEEIFLQAQTDPDRQGMGATCACAWVIRDRLYTAAVGDSRIYLLRGKTIRQLSIDHTWIQEALERGVLKPDEVRGHPNAHVIRRYLGSPTPPQVDFRLRLDEGESDRQAAENQGLALKEGDRLLLCSDGLTDLVDDSEILAAFQHKSLEDALESLTDLANQRGGHDNITLVALQAPIGAFQRPISVLRLAAVSLSLLLLAAIITAWWFFGQDEFNKLVSGAFRTDSTPTLNFLITSAPLEGSLPTGYPPAASAGPPLTTSSILSPITTPTPTLAGYPPAGGGPTLTPWPTNTPKP
jgi:PPM family protein phosphatase